MAKKSVQVDQAEDPTVASDVTDTSAPQDAPEAPEPQEATEAPADEETPAEDAPEPAEEESEPEQSDDQAETPAEEPVTPPQPPEQPAPAEASGDLTPREEAERQVSGGRGQIDGSGILQQTNQEVIDNFPKNENGQVVIDSEGQIVGLNQDSQPAPQSGSAA